MHGSMCALHTKRQLGKANNPLKRLFHFQNLTFIAASISGLKTNGLLNSKHCQAFPEHSDVESF